MSQRSTKSLDVLSFNSFFRQLVLLSLCLSTTLFSLMLGPSNANAMGPGFDLKGKTFVPNFSSFPLFFRAASNFQEFYLGMVINNLRQNSAHYLESQHTPKEPEKEEWRMPDEIRREVQKEGDPIPPYKRYDELWHTVERRETKRRIEEMYRYPSNQLSQLNPIADLENLREGQKVLVWRRPPYPSESVGKANRGRLLYGEPLKPTNAFKLIYPHRVFGTTHTVATIQSVLDAFHSRFPSAHPLLIGDISMRGGRFTEPHHSHQSGRDADISYPTISHPTQFRRFTRTRTRNLDAEQALWLFKRLIDTGYVEYIFVDRRLQRLLVKEAERQGAPKEWIQSVFQYHGKANALIRHARGHINHFHVRFRCTVSDPRCRDSIPARDRELNNQEMPEDQQDTMETGGIED